MVLIFLISYSNSVICQKLKFYYSTLVRVTETSMQSAWNNSVQMVATTRKISKDCTFENYDTPFFKILHFIICFMVYSVCIAPTLITALISQCVTKMVCHYNYSHTLLAFLKYSQLNCIIFSIEFMWFSLFQNYYMNKWSINHFCTA